MRQLIGVCGSGDIGADPWDLQTWSGSSRFFFGECRARGLLLGAYGFELPRVQRAAYMIRNFHRDRAVWRRLFYMDTGYRAALSRVIGKHTIWATRDADVMQLGAMYDIADLVAGDRRLYSYNDGNFLTGLRSPFFPQGISSARIDRTLEYERAVNEKLDLVFTMSEFLRRSFIVDYGIEERLVHNVGAGINFDSIPSPLPGKDYCSKEMLFIGRMFSRKGGEVLIKSFRAVRERIPEARLHIVGPSRMPSALAGVTGVEFHGFLRKTIQSELRELESLFARCSLFVMPSLYEPFGIAPLEAMSRGLACVVSDAWALPELVGPDSTGVTSPVGDAEALSEALIELLKDPDRLRRYGDEGPKWVKRRFTWSGVVDRVERAINSLDG